jgi:microcystin-dependent protein
VNQSDYLNLFNAIKDNFGYTSSQFYLPNLEGKFVRGWNGRTLPESANYGGTTKWSTTADDIKQHTHTVSEVGNHTHAITVTYTDGNDANVTTLPTRTTDGNSRKNYSTSSTSSAEADTVVVSDRKVVATNAGAGGHSHTLSGGPTAIETKPYNIVLMPYIRWK